MVLGRITSFLFRDMVHSDGGWVLGVRLINSTGEDFVSQKATKSHKHFEHCIFFFKYTRVFTMSASAYKKVNNLNKKMQTLVLKKFAF